MAAADGVAVEEVVAEGLAADVAGDTAVEVEAEAAAATLDGVPGAEATVGEADRRLRRYIILGLCMCRYL